MIKNKTVFVLGAGASAPYNFPLGASLVDQICREVLEHENNSGNTLSKRLQRLGFNHLKVREFAQELRKARPYSLDAFIETRAVFREVAKAAIADVLLRAEADSSLSTAAEDVDWYRYLFNKFLLVRNRDHYLEQARNLSIVTFNFDRSFEHALFQSLIANFGLNGHDARALSQELNVLHVHGLLGTLDSLQPGDEQHSNMYGPGETHLAAATEIARHQIKIVDEEISPTVVAAATRALNEARSVYFLGFGFDERNLLKVELPRCLTGSRIVGTAFRMTRNEQSPVRRCFQSTGGRIDLYDIDALGFLRGHADSLFE